MRKNIIISTCLVLAVLIGAFANIGFHVGSNDNYQRAITIGNVLTLTIGPESALAATTPDYTCDGTADDVQFQAALNALPANGGKILVLGGQYNFTSTVTRAIDNVIFEGMGYSSYFVYNGAADIFTAGGNNWVIKDIRFDAGGVGFGSTTDWQMLRCWEGGNLYVNRTESDADTIVLPVGRTADVVVAANDSSDYAKSQADIICNGTNDEVDLLASITTAGNSNASVLWLAGTYVLGSQLDIPVLQNFYLEANGATFIGEGIEMDSNMNSVIRLGIIAGETNDTGLLIKPTNDAEIIGPEIVNKIVASNIYINAIVGSGTPLAGACLETDVFNGTGIESSVITIDELHTHDINVLMNNPNGTGVIRWNKFDFGILRNANTNLQIGTTGTISGINGNTYNVRSVLTKAGGENISCYANDEILNVNAWRGPTTAITWETSADDNIIYAGDSFDSYTQTDNSTTNTNVVIRPSTVYSKEEFFPCTYGNTIFGKYAGIPGARINGDGQTANIVFNAPSDLVQVDEINIVWMPLVSGTTMITSLSTNYGASGQGVSAHTQSGTLSRAGVNANTWYEDDIKSVVSSLAANDFVGLELERKTGSIGNTNSWFYGIRLKYTTAGG